MPNVGRSPTLMHAFSAAKPRLTSGGKAEPMLASGGKAELMIAQDSLGNAGAYPHSSNYGGLGI